MKSIYTALIILLFQLSYAASPQNIKIRALGNADFIQDQLNQFDLLQISN